MPTNHLPTSATPFVGRQRELDEIVGLLNEPNAHLITILAPGGMGKTRLALEAARLQTGRYADGVFFVPLAPLSAASDIITTIAENISFSFYGERALAQQLIDFLRERSMLLVLDNFEHLLDGVSLVGDLVQSAAGIRVLVTSRERLNLRAETVYGLGGLDFPTGETPEDALGYEAVTLFLQSAQRVRPDFAIRGENLDDLARICRLTGGMPLGIELAAGWVDVLSLEQIAAELERGLDILETELRDVPERQRSLRATFERTWERLTDDEQRVFMRLSVFRGGFTVEAARAVAETDLRSLRKLANKALVQVSPEGRHDLHELLRQFAAQKLNADPIEYANTQDRHSVFYAQFLSQRSDDLKGRRQRGALDEITTDFDNVRAAWYWMTAQKNNALVNQMVESLCLFCDMRSRFQEGVELFGHTKTWFASDPSGEAERTWGRVTARWVEMWRLQAGGSQGDELVKSAAQKSFAIARKYDDQSEIAYSLWLQGVLDFLAQDFTQAIIPFEESFALYTVLDDPFNKAQLADYLGAIIWRSGDYDRADGLTQQSIDLRRALGDGFGLASTLNSLTTGAVSRGDYQKAAAYLRETDAIYLELGNEVKLARNSGIWARIAFYQGDFELARTLAQRAVDKTSEAMNSGKWQSLSILSLLASMDGDYAQARLLAESITAEDQYYGAPKALAIAACGLGDEQTARHYFLIALRAEASLIQNQGFIWRSMLPVAVILLVREGEPEQAVEVLALALSYPDPASATGWMEKWSLLAQTRAELEAQLPPDVFAAAWERGKTRSLAEVVNGLIQRWQPAADEAQPSAVQSANRSLTEPLSERELDVLHLIAAGASNQEIAQQLVIGLSTVKKHVNHIFDKLSVESRTQAIVRARALNFL